MLLPTSLSEMQEIVREGQPLALQGGGTRLLAQQTGRVVSTRNFSGVTLYEPSEMVIRAKSGTPLGEIESLLASHRQRLPFEPFRLHRGKGDSTIGGVAATNASGPRRFHAGACRDAMIGVSFINGLGQEIKSGGRVMKDVTGYDFVKLMAGSHGSLGLITEVAFKLLPVPETEATLRWTGLSDDAAILLMTEAWGSPFEITGAAHRAHGETMLRIEGFADSVDYRAGELARRFASYGDMERLTTDPWGGIGDGSFAANEHHALWRITTAPTRAAQIAEAIRPAHYYYDWAGGLIWLSVPPDDAASRRVRDAATRFSANSTLMSGPKTLRHWQFQPQPAPLAALSAKIKQSFDPNDIFAAGPF